MENKEPSGDDNAEQEARSEEDKQKTEQLIESQRKGEPITAKLVLGILNVYLLFVTALVAFGVLAYYGGHLTILKAVFVASGLLLLVLPVSGVWYWWSRYRRSFPPKATPNESQTRLANLAVRMVTSPVGKFLTRFTNHRIFQLYQYLQATFMIVWAIKRFPREPRLSLTIVVIYMVGIFALVILALSSRLVLQIQEGWKTHAEIVQILKHLNLGIHYAQTTADYAKSIAEINSKYINDTAPADSEIHKIIFTAIEKTNDAVQALDSTTTLLNARLDAMTEPKQLDAATADDGER